MPKILTLIKQNPQLCLASGLLLGGLVTVNFMPPFAGALVGAGASLLGAWMAEWNKKKTSAEEKETRQVEARQYMVPELYRSIERLLYIHDRAIANFSCASAESDLNPGDQKIDFMPFHPVLYPNSERFRDLSADDAMSLVAFYDSLHTLDGFVADWWERPGQLPANIFNMILHYSDKSLAFALICIEKFGQEKTSPPSSYKSFDDLSAKISTSRSSASKTREHHIKRLENTK